jgi:hypothetical protein
MKKEITTNTMEIQEIIIDYCENLYSNKFESLEEMDKFLDTYVHLKLNQEDINHLIFDKGAKNIGWKKDTLFNKCCWEKWLSNCKKLKLDPYLTLYTSINSKWIKDLNIRPKTLKLVQKRSGNTLELIDIGKDFLNRTPAAQQLRERMNKWDFIKLRSFCTTKDMVSKETTHRVEENICQLYLRQRTDNQNMQGAQKTKLPPNQ